MFITLAKDEFSDLFYENFPDDPANPQRNNIRWWKSFEMPIAAAWLIIFLRDHIDELDGVKMIFDPDDFPEIINSTRVTVQSVTIAAPPNMSGRDEWCFEKIVTASTAQDKSTGEPLWIFRGQSGHDYIFSHEINYKGSIKRRTLIYSAE